MSAQSHHGGPAMANDAQMPELDAAIERLKAATPKTAPWTVWDFSDRGEVPIDKEIAIILNAVVSGELSRSDLCASGQQVRSVRWRVFESAFGRGCWGIEIDGDLDADAILPPQKLAREDLVAIVDAHNAALTPAPQAAQEAVPVACGESYDGGAFFNTVSLTKTKHHTYPLYAHPPQPSASVVEALRELVTACEAYPVNIARADAALDNAHAALRALKGGS